MAIQLDEPMTVTRLGQFDPSSNRGTYHLSLVRAEDNKILATADLDMSQNHPDAMGFKYVRLNHPVQLEVSAEPVVIYPRGLLPATIYEVHASIAGVHLLKTGSQLMSDGISLDRIAGAEN